MERFLLSLLSVLVSSAGAGFACDLKLLLSWDVSASISEHEYALQRHGTAMAFRDAKVQNSISLMPNGVAVSILQWAGPGEQEVSLPWTMLHNGHDVARMADVIDFIDDPFDERTGTAVGNGLRSAAEHLATGPEDCARVVVDISGDGAANIRLPTTPEADALIANGVVVNALVLPQSAKLGVHDPFMFYVHEVARGPESFVIDVSSYEDYWRALRMKILRELTPYYARSNCMPDGWNPERC